MNARGLRFLRATTGFAARGGGVAAALAGLLVLTPVATAQASRPATRPSTSGPAVARVGSPAPTLALVRLNGAPVAARAFAGKPTVLVFGSLSSPALRDRVPRLDALKQRLGGRAGVYIVYTREAYPTDGPWAVKRNAADKIDARQPATMAERVALATRLRERTKTTVEVLIDGMDDAVLTAFGDRPDAAVVLNAAGTVTAVQNFCDPSGLPRLVDEAAMAKD